MSLHHNKFVVKKSGLEEIAPLRQLFLSETTFQFIHNKCHLYGWADTYSFEYDGLIIGYGSVWGKDNRKDRDTIFEFYLLPNFRHQATAIFQEFLNACAVQFIECQTNDALLSSMMFEFAQNIQGESILFEDHSETQYTIPGIHFRRREDYKSSHNDDVGGYMLELNGEIVANGGLLLNYNFPYADVYMDVNEPFRQKGFGTFMVQELKREAYRLKRVPAARCNISNRISKATLQKAGFKVCGCWLIGQVKEKKI